MDLHNNIMIAIWGNTRESPKAKVVFNTRKLIQANL